VSAASVAAKVANRHAISEMHIARRRRHEQAYQLSDVQVQANVPDDLSPVATVMSPMLPGDWRSMRPIVDRDKCVKCAVCWLYCPVQCVEEKPAWFDFNLANLQGMRHLR
jgi:phenylglyoxylate dehydrogenase delta subunit